MAKARGVKNQDRGWAIVESYATTSQPGEPQSQKEYEAYLGAFSHAVENW